MLRVQLGSKVKINLESILRMLPVGVNLQAKHLAIAITLA